MTPKAAACPSEKILADYGLGRLDQAAIDTVHSHLETCVDCRRVVASLSNDSFIDRLRSAKLAAAARQGDSVSNADPRTDTPTGSALPPDRSPPAASRPASSASPRFTIPAELANHPDYEVVKELGSGGMGVVYLARNRMMDRLEVLKVVSRSLLDKPGSRDRFQQEIRSAAKLQHPNIVAAHSVLRLGNLLVFAMEYVDGKDLSKVVKQRGPLPVPNAAFYVQQVALGLQHAHEQGMVHRDIKPNNLMLSIAGKKHVVKILDFGLAKATMEKKDEERLTQSGEILGTPDYIAPEQTLDAQKADIRADIYSLGCTLFFLLSGRPPFPRNSVFETLAAHYHSQAEALNVLRPDVPAELNAVVAKMMAKDPAKRYQTPDEVAKALVPFYKGGGQSVAATSDVEPISDPKLIESEGSFEAAFSETTSFSVAAVSDAAQPPGRTTYLAMAVWTKLAAGNRKKPPIKLIATGAAGLFALVLGVIVIFHNEKGDEIARVEVPQATSAEVKLQEPAHANKALDEGKADKPTAAAPTKPAFPGGNTNPNAGQGAATKTGGSPPTAKAPFDLQQARAHQEAWAKYLGTTVETTNSIGMKLVLIPPGEFMMGSPNAESGRSENEGPQHGVRISKPFYLGACEVTQAEYQQVMFASSRSGKTLVAGEETSRFPMEQISWDDATRFCERLSTREGKQYRLPTEAEWEYACRAGTTTRFSFGDNDADLEQHDWYGKNAHGRARGVGLKLPNSFGLYDMHGNVWEWCSDYYGDYNGKWHEKSPQDDPFGPPAGSSRVVRGGHCGYNNASYCRSDFRFNSPTLRNLNAGFRCLLSLDGSTVTVNATKSITPTPVVAPAPAINLVGPTPPPAVAPFDAKQARALQEAWAKHLGTTVETINSIGAKMVLIPPGEFLMGSTDEQVEAGLKMAEEINSSQHAKSYLEKTERPRHRVVITKPLWVGATEVTIGQFKRFAAAKSYRTEAEQAKAATKTAPPRSPIQTYLNPPYAVTDESPVEAVAWNDAVAYCNWLSEQENAIYRLPTEAEWEYACRAGTTTQYSFGDDYAELEKYAWHDQTAGRKPHSVGSKLPNAFGLFDMHGNTQEWCQDFHDGLGYSQKVTEDPTGLSAGHFRVTRGGNWYANACNCRSASRINSDPAPRNYHNGFRCVRAF